MMHPKTPTRADAAHRALLSITILSLLTLTGLGAAGADTDAPARPQSRPNIVLILTDDQTGLLNTMDSMPRLQAVLADHGVTFSNMRIPTPLCCPARVTLLRSQYVHNHTVFYNTPPLGGFARVQALGLEQATLATALQVAGYRTVLLGKYLNGYPLPDAPTYVPPGWNEWYAGANEAAYGSYNYQLNENGVLVSYGNRPDDYITDVIAAKTANFITRTVTLSPGVPFFAYVSVYAPHAPANPAPRHASLFPNAQAPRTPSFNEADMGDKPPFMQAFPLLSADDIAGIDALYRQQLRSLQAVDELVERIVHVLADTGQLNNTYIIFTSDNGFHLGQHRFEPGKGTPFTEDLSVPLVVRGPGIPAGLTRAELVSIIDLAPTIVDWAGVSLGVPADGRSLTPLLRTPGETSSWRTALFFEHWHSPGAQAADGNRSNLEPPDPFDQQLDRLGQSVPDYSGLETASYKYIRRTGGNNELYDLVHDPYELMNQYDNVPSAFKAQLLTWLNTFQACAGPTCRSIETQQPPELTLLYPRADVDRNGRIDIYDVTAVATCWRQPISPTCGDRFDIDHDADIEIVDVQYVAGRVVGQKE